MSIAIAGPHARADGTTLPGVNAKQLAALAEPFALGDLEWKVQSAGVSGSGKVWAKIAPYVTNRAICERLDDVLGPANWQNLYFPAPVQGDGMMCGIGVNVGGTWIWKYDGAGSVVESRGLGSADAMKGTFSNAMKRAAVQWGIGRPLYYLDVVFADVLPEDAADGDGVFTGIVRPKGEGQRPVFFKWRVPPRAIPEWCLPGGSGRPPMATQATQATRPRPAAPPAAPPEREFAPPPPGSPPPEPEPPRARATARGATEAREPYTGPAPEGCPKCGGDMWDNREKKRSGRFKKNAPDFSCKNKDGCGYQLWPGQWPPKDPEASLDLPESPNDDPFFPDEEDDDLPF